VDAAQTKELEESGMMRIVGALVVSMLWAGPSLADTCWITPLQELVPDGENRIAQVGNFSQNADGTQITVIVVTTVTSTEQSAVMPVGNQIARVVCDIQVFFAVGFNPTATIADNYMSANSPEYIGIDAGHKIAFCDADCA
jgi:hypothetical protein